MRFYAIKGGALISDKMSVVRVLGFMRYGNIICKGRWD